MSYRRLGLLLLALTLWGTPAIVSAKGGSGDAGATVFLSRVAGLATAIDYANNRIAIEQSYYGSAVLSVNSATKVRINRIEAKFNDHKLNAFCEGRYDAATRTAAKIEATR
jgi:hypothetical protein